MRTTTLSLLFVLQLMCLGTTAQNINKYYRSHIASDGTTYFILPQKMSRTANSTATRDMEFDLTKVSTIDSIAFTTSVFTPEPLSVDSILIVRSDGTRLAAKAETIFVDFKKKAYKTRLRFSIPYPEFKALYAQPTPYTVEMPKGAAFAVQPKKWQKHADVIRRLTTIFDLNPQ